MESKLCRICYSTECDSSTGPFISPCLCKGSIKYVHATCLDNWRLHSETYSSLTSCSLCKTEYRLIPRKSKDKITFFKKIMKFLYRLLMLPKRILIVLLMLGSVSMVVITGIMSIIATTPVILINYLLGEYDREFEPPTNSSTSSYKKNIVDTYEVVDLD